MSYQVYKNAFKCHKCPGNNGINGCPVWLNMTLKNDVTGEQKADGGCGFQFIPRILTENTRAVDQFTENVSNFPARLGKVVEEKGLLEDKN